MIKNISTVAGVALLLSQTAYAVNPDFLITHRVATFNSASETSKVDDTETDSSTTSIDWMDPANVEFAMFHEGWAVYAYPFSSSATLWVGKSVGPVEVGPTLQFSMKNIEDGMETNGFTLGAYVFYGMDLGAVGLETNINPYFASSSTTTPEQAADAAAGTTATPKSEVSSSGFGVFADLLVTKKIGDNFTWGGGLELLFDSSTEKNETTVAGTKTEVETEKTATTFGVVLSEFRYAF